MIVTNPSLAIILGQNSIVLQPHSWSSKWLLTQKYPFEILCPYAFSDLVNFMVFSWKAVVGKGSLVLSTLYRVLVCTDLHLFLHSIALVSAQDLLKTACISLVQQLFLLCPQSASRTHQCLPCQFLLHYKWLVFRGATVLSC